MILFINVFLANDQGSPFVGNTRYCLPQEDRLRVFKYMLASYAVIPWSSVVIYVELDTRYCDERDALEAYIYGLFPGATLSWRRNSHQRDWQKALEAIFAIDDNLIWYAGNHDHIFIDSTLDNLLALQAATEAETDPYKGFHYSHYPDMMHWTAIHDFPQTWFGNGLTRCTMTQVTSVHALSKAVLKAYFWDTNLRDAFVPRTDWFPAAVRSQRFIGYGHVKELCRHFDAYDYRPTSYAWSGADCPPLSIPAGFFEGDIHIQYGGAARKANAVWVKPDAAHYLALHPGGADMKCLLEDLPLFWRGRIGKINILTEAGDTTRLREARNRAILDTACARFLGDESRPLLPPPIRECLIP